MKKVYTRKELLNMALDELCHINDNFADTPAAEAVEYVRKNNAFFQPEEVLEKLGACTNVLQAVKTQLAMLPVSSPYNRAQIIIELGEKRLSVQKELLEEVASSIPFKLVEEDVWDWNDVYSNTTYLLEKEEGRVCFRLENQIEIFADSYCDEYRYRIGEDISDLPFIGREELESFLNSDN